MCPVPAAVSVSTSVVNGPLFTQQGFLTFDQLQKTEVADVNSWIMSSVRRFQLHQPGKLQAVLYAPDEETWPTTFLLFAIGTALNAEAYSTIFSAFASNRLAVVSIDISPGRMVKDSVERLVLSLEEVVHWLSDTIFGEDWRVASWIVGGHSAGGCAMFEFLADNKAASVLTQRAPIRGFIGFDPYNSSLSSKLKSLPLIEVLDQNSQVLLFGHTQKNNLISPAEGALKFVSPRYFKYVKQSNIHLHSFSEPHTHLSYVDDGVKVLGILPFWFSRLFLSFGFPKANQELRDLVVRKTLEIFASLLLQAGVD